MAIPRHQVMEYCGCRAINHRHKPYFSSWIELEEHLSAEKNKQSQVSFELMRKLLIQNEKEIKYMIRDFFKMISNELSYQSEKSTFDRIKGELFKKKKFREKYVAIVNSQVVDYDKGSLALIKRVYKNYGYRPVYIGLVSKEKKRVEIPSPEIH